MNGGDPSPDYFLVTLKKKSSRAAKMAVGWAEGHANVKSLGQTPP